MNIIRHKALFIAFGPDGRLVYSAATSLSGAAQTCCVSSPKTSKKEKKKKKKELIFTQGKLPKMPSKTTQKDWGEGRGPHGLDLKQAKNMKRKGKKQRASGSGGGDLRVKEAGEVGGEAALFPAFCE